MFMASIDLEDAFSVPIYEDHQKFLTFLSRTTMNLSAYKMVAALQCVFLQKP